MRRHRLPTQLLLLFLLPSWLSSQIAAKTITLKDSDNHSHVALSTGDELIVKLTSNPTTGYSWSPAEPFLLLPLISSKFVAARPGHYGTPGHQVFTFKAKHSGKVALVLHYSRSFEKDVPPAKTFRVVVSIEGSAQPPGPHP
jgi:inhibitor of cysteine peptidase